MSAIPRVERTPLRSRFNFVRRVRLSRKLMSIAVLVLCGVLGIGTLFFLKPTDVLFEYTAEKGCIDEERIRDSIVRQQLVWSVFSLAGQLKNEYGCIDQISLAYRPPAVVLIKTEVKDVVFGVQTYNVDVNDQVSWKQIFSQTRDESELYFISLDGSITQFSHGAQVPRLVFLRTDERDALTSSTVEKLIRLQNILNEKDKSMPKFEVYSNNVVKVSSVTFEELYLPLDESLEVQLGKADAIAKFLTLRGADVMSIDARLRDIVVSPR